jgi:hypothetical protein
LSNIDDLNIELNKYITPILAQIQFEGPIKKNSAYEYHFSYSRRDIVIDYSIEIGNDLPRLSIQFYKEPIKKNIDSHPYRYYNYIDLEPESEVLNIYKRSSERIDPTVKEYIQHLGKPEGNALSEKLNEDYQSVGYSELGHIVVITGDFLKKNIDLMKLEDSLKIRRVLKKKVRANKIKRTINKIKHRYFQ